jgi:hypothetical protein
MPDVYIGQIWVAVSVVMAVVYFRMNRRADRTDEMRRTATRGEAQIVEMTQTGTYVNEQPRVKLKLRISAPGIAPFEDERTETVPLIALGRLSSGVPLTVFLRPEAPEDYVIDWSGGAAPSPDAGIAVQSAQSPPVDIGGNVAAKEAVMRALEEHGVDTSSGSVDLRKPSAAREAVLAALREHGVDVAHSVAAQDPTTPIEETGEPLERMMKLEQLRSANLISAEEFKRHRQRILNDL